MTRSGLVLTGVELRRGGRVLVSDLSFGLEPGQLALVTGPNGSGKTTLLRTVAGFAPPGAGEILVGGTPVAGLEPEARREIAYQGHLEGLKKDLTVYENIQFINQLRSKSDAISKTLATLGLEPFADRSVRHLSAGQKRRTALAALKVSGASLWLLDEPLTNLDPAGRELVLGWIDEHLAGQGMALVATHLADVLKRPGSLLVEL
ncbi:MAG TPA: heme ABC exporter ATP-binding protein CcmA [Gammaproteobacteria bacterium]|nr:heme ABC exporter ATP-binding protein CcmA [Gammaproteobacteria bacterium]